MRRSLLLILLLFSLLLTKLEAQTKALDFYKTSKPYTRWWWYSGVIEDEAIRYQLDWAKENNFGGVEIAFVYPLIGAKSGPKWLSLEWVRMCNYAKQYADKIGLGCDFTFGTVWPFGGSIVSEQDASKLFDGLSPQRMEKSWELNYETKPSYVLNHLDSMAFQRYSDKVGGAMKLAFQGKQCAIFCDSWEVEGDLWTDGFDKAFKLKYQYDIVPLMKIINKFPDVKYDYNKLVSEYIINGFYKQFTKIAHSLNTFSRVQCMGSPTDMLKAYSNVDVPESEALLYEPSFSAIPASAALLSSKKTVSAEAFTCLYGWKAWRGPAPYEKKEQTADMKLIADALFANGINMIVWHGMPYNPKGGNNEFYATVHVGPDSYFADEIPAFNKYMEKVSFEMKQGRSYTDVAVYFPLEDVWIPEYKDSSKQEIGVGVKGLKLPAELKAYHSLWFSGDFLKDAIVDKGMLKYNNITFNSLYVDSKWMDIDNLTQIVRLGRDGLNICIKRKPLQAGKIKDPVFNVLINELMGLPNVKTDIKNITNSMPLIKASSITDYWCRVTDDGYTIFFSNPKSNDLHYPLKYGQSLNDATVKQTVEIKSPQNEYKQVNLTFSPYQSLMLKINNNGSVSFEDINFLPKKPKQE